MSPGYTLLLVVAIALIVSFGTIRIIDNKLSKITLNLPKIKVPPQEVILKVDNQDQCQVKINGKNANLRVETFQTSPKYMKKKGKKLKSKVKKTRYNPQYHNQNPYQQLYEKFDVIPQLPPQARNQQDYLH